MKKDQKESPKNYLKIYSAVPNSYTTHILLCGGNKKTLVDMRKRPGTCYQFYGVLHVLFGHVCIISENRQYTTSEWGFGLLTFIQSTTEQTGGAKGLN